MTTCIGKYEKIEKAGGGTYGLVYKARNIETNEIVAIKKIKDDQDQGVACTALREISILKSLKHQNIVRFVTSIQ